TSELLSLITDESTASFELLALSRPHCVVGFFFQAEDGIRDRNVTGVQTCALPILVLAILAPLVVLIGIIRLVASPAFLWLEYHRPGFPADPFGMSTEQRLNYGSYGLDYLFNLAPQSYLAELTFADGNPVFTQA